MSRKQREKVDQLAPVLLDWYDRHARNLPWRARGSEQADPYKVWLSEIMLQQTTVGAVIPYFEKFTRAWPGLEDLARAPLDDVLLQWAGLGYYARARNMHKCARQLVAEFAATFPDNEAALLHLPGIGPYTAAAISAIAFGKPAVVVDGNVERVMARLHNVATPLPVAKPQLYALAASHTPVGRAGDYAQAVMDLGATICTPRKPDCPRCPLMSHCAGFATSSPEILPQRAPKKVRPVRRGTVFWCQTSDGFVLARKRAPKGLLGAMMEIPATPWTQSMVQTKAQLTAGSTAQAGSDPLAHAPFDLDWVKIQGTVQHVFTHFHVELEVWKTSLADSDQVVLPNDGSHWRWASLDRLEDYAFPSVMKKIIAHACQSMPASPLKSSRRAPAGATNLSV